MMLVVTGVGTLIHIYAIGYMHGDIDEAAHKRHLPDEEATLFKRKRYPKFFTYFNLFLGSMLILVTGDNYLMMFVGWELVGLCSYLLIGFWFDDPANGLYNSYAGRKAFVVNRVGDFGMLAALFLIFWTFGTLQFDDVFARAECMKAESQAACLTLSAGEAAEGQHIEEEAGEHAEEAAAFTTPIALGVGTTVALGAVVTAITLFLLLGATGKSAQIPLFVWLPDAMAGPTPVSALIHAATMVTAGIYMITRSHALYALAPVSQTTVAIVGAATALLAATIAVGQFDIKRVLAYSTISQLGFMVAAVGLGGYVAGMFHLVTHAFFKALLFLSAGSVIQALERGQEHVSGASHAVGGGGDDEHAGEQATASAHPAERGASGADAHSAGHHGPDPQDMRNMGGLWSKLPVTKWVYLIGALALAGIPPFAGFFSKDEILLDALNKNPVVLGLLLTAAFFTAFYMGRQILMVFFGAPRTDAARHATESPWIVTIPLMILALLSLVGGGLNLPGVQTLTEWLGHTLGEHEAGEFNVLLAGAATGLALVAMAISYAIYRGKPTTAEAHDPLQGMLGPVFTGMNRKWWVDEFYDLIILRPYNWLARVSADVIDGRFWHDWFHDSLLAGLFNIFARVLADGVDKGFVDPVISDFPADLSKGIAAFFRRVQTGFVRSYALAVFVGVVVILGYFLVVR